MRIKISLVLAVAVTMLAGAAAQADANYRQPLMFRWNRAHLDTIIIPPNHGQLYNGNGVLGGGQASELSPYETSYLRAIEESIADWHRGIDEFAPAWLKNNLSNPVYVLGRDPIPPEVLQGVDILVITDENKAFALGFALYTAGRCVVNNSKMFITSFTEEDMYNVNSQEYGHCLGLGHVNEVPAPAPANPNDALMRHDSMNGVYADNPGSVGVHRHCVSNLNIKGLEEVYRQTIQGGSPGQFGVIAKSSYQRTDCE